MTPWLLASTLLVLLVVAAATVWMLRRLRAAMRPPWQPRPLPPRALVLVHGVCGFEELRFLGFRRAYFAGIAPHLEALGIPVHQARLPPLGSVPERAAALASFIRGVAPGAARVDVIAHSMGGLDVRYAIARLGLGDKVASLVTIGTPHHGTPLAELGHVGPALTLRALGQALGVPSDSLDWLTPRRMAAFNRDIPDDPRVRYASVVCRAGAELWRENPLLLATHAYVKYRAGSNDGIVPAASQRWGDTLCEIDADHWAQIGWSTGGDARPLYEGIVRALRPQLAAGPAASPQLLGHDTSGAMGAKSHTDRFWAS